MGGDRLAEASLGTDPSSVRAAAGRFARLLDIVATVVVEPGLGPADLAAAAGISERTLFRDLAHLRGLGYDIEHDHGYRFEERLDFDGPPGNPGSLSAAFDRHAAALRAELGPGVAEGVVEDVSAIAPAALASLFAAAIRRRVGIEGVAPLRLSGR